MLASIIRTICPVVVGVLLGWAAKIGLDLPEGAVTELVTVLATFVYYTTARWVETWWPAGGRILLAAGLTKKQPNYDLVA